MFEKEINIIKQNLNHVMYINLPTSKKMTVIGYGIVDNIIHNDIKELKVLCFKHEPTHYKFPWKTELDKYNILVDKEMNPDEFIAVKYNCIKQDKNNEFLSCY